MSNTLKYISDLKKILKQENIDNDMFEIASRFGAIKTSLNYDDEVSSHLNDMEIILKKSLTNGSFSADDKLDLFSMFGALENHIKKESTDSENNFLDSATMGLTASAGARVLMGAGPMGMLAAGVLGVAAAYILQDNEDPHISNKDLLTIAYYLSRFEHEHLFGLGLSSAKAMEAIGNVLNVNVNTIRGKRDYFDTLLPLEDRVSSRKGYSQIKSTKKYEEIIKEYSYITNDDEQKMRKVIIGILKKYQDKLVLK